MSRPLVAGYQAGLLRMDSPRTDSPGPGRGLGKPPAVRFKTHGVRRKQMGTKPWLSFGAVCLGGVLLCGCQNDDKRFSGPFNSGVSSNNKPGTAANPAMFPGTGSGT